jgi:hypothetical protein
MRMMSEAELTDRLGAAASPTQFRLFFAALLRVQAGVSPDRFYVVGGSAIEVYTVGRYTSGDIDIVTDQDEAVRRVLRHWRFSRQARVWAHDRLSLVVDLVKWPYTGSEAHTTLASTPYGPVRLAAVEDLLVKRLSSTKHWRIPGDMEHAKMLAAEFGVSMDWSYVEKLARDHDVGELLAEVRQAVGAQAPSKGGR